MKKLIATLGACLLTATSAGAAVSCSSNQSDSSDVLSNSLLNANVKSYDEWQHVMEVSLSFNTFKLSHIQISNIMANNITVQINGATLKPDVDFSFDPAEGIEQQDNGTLKIATSVKIDKNLKITVRYFNETAVNVDLASLYPQFSEAILDENNDSTYELDGSFYVPFASDLKGSDFNVYENNTQLKPLDDFIVRSVNGNEISDNVTIDFVKKINIHDKFFIQYKDENKFSVTVKNTVLTNVRVSSHYDVNFSYIKNMKNFDSKKVSILINDKAYDGKTNFVVESDGNITIWLNKALPDNVRFKLLYDGFVQSTAWITSAINDVRANFWDYKEKGKIDLDFDMPNLGANFADKLMIFSGTKKLVNATDYTLQRQSTTGDIHVAIMVKDYKNYKHICAWYDNKTIISNY